MDRGNTGQQRDMVYCHQCENEWYRDEHGLVCPECESDFTEIIEPNQDIRGEQMSPLGESGTHEWYAPDPDEEDIEHFQWRNNGHGQPQIHNPFEHNMRGFTYGAAQGRPQPQPGPQPGGLLGMLGSMLGGGQQQQQQQQQPPQSPPQQQGHNPWHNTGETYRTVTTPGGGRTVVRHTSGPNFSFTITTSTNSALHPRDANQPQPFEHQPDHIEQFLGQMIMNIGAVPGHGGPGRMGPGGPVLMGFGGGGAPREFGGAPGQGTAFPFGDLLSFLMPAGGVHGDAVYSQEALDRIITQLMEQHQTGNAPGPASEDAIDSLPTREITKADQGTSDGGKAECSICMDEAALGTSVTVLPCDHWFHHECIKAWLSEHDTCPHCRRGIMPKDEPNTNRPRQPSQAPLHDMHSPEYHRPHTTPGDYPFPRQASPEASRSPPARSPGSSGTGLFDRMREAFSGGGSNQGNRGSNPPQ